MIKLIDTVTLSDGNTKFQEKEFSTEAAFRKQLKYLPGLVRYSLLKKGLFEHESPLGKHKIEIIRCGK